MPILEIDGHCLTQLLAQIEHLDETLNLGLLPSSPVERAEVRALSYVIAMETHPVCNLNAAKWAVEQSGQKIMMDAWMRHFINNGLEAYEQMVKDKEFSYGNGVTIADICLAPRFTTLRVGAWICNNSPKSPPPRKRLTLYQPFSKHIPIKQKN